MGIKKKNFSPIYKLQEQKIFLFYTQLKNKDFNKLS